VAIDAEFTSLMARGTEVGRVGEFEIEALSEHLELDEAQVEQLRDRLAAAGVEVHDDCGRDAPATTYATGDLAHYTVDAMTQFLADASRYPLLSAAEEIDLARRIERGDLMAKEKLIASNLRLVVSIAKRHQVSAHMTLLDLVQEGMLGLIRAAEKYDWRRGFKFSTYATLWIRQAIQRGLDKNARVIRLPVGVLQQERKLAAAHRSLLVTLGREPTFEELADATGLQPHQISELAGAPRVTTSLDRPVGEQGETTLGEILTTGATELGDEIRVSLEREHVRHAVDQLGEPERSVIRLRFGLDGDREPQTYAAIGRQLGIRPGRVRTCEEKGLRQLALHRELEGLLAA
jgi:RNA polymerase primary sigma factor